MITNFADLDLDKTYTYSDYITWQFQERLELIKGKIFKMSPAPKRIHQDVSLYVSSTLYQFLKNHPCKVYAAPFDVRLIRKDKGEKLITTVLQPDICIICDMDKLDDKGCLGAPDIVVEILSPGNNRKELKNKFEVYEENEVKEYWIIHPDEKTFMSYILDENGKYQPTALKTMGDIITTKILPGFELDLEKTFDY